MRVYGVLWTMWVLAFVFIEAAAILHGSFESTLTGHAVQIMRAHPFLMVAVPTVLIGVAIHFLIEAFRVT